MKQFITIVIVFATCFLVPLSARSVKEEDGVVRIDLESRLQTNEGWGVSLCWWAPKDSLSRPVFAVHRSDLDNKLSRQ